MKRVALCNLLIVAALVVPAGGAVAAPIFADSAVSLNTLPFGSGTLTGAPDSGGESLSDTSDPPTLMGTITAGFDGGLVDGAGHDIVIWDCCGVGPDFASVSATSPEPDESGDVFVSTDGVTFTLLGAYGGPSLVNSFDLSGVFAGVVHYVRIVGTSTTNSADIDAFEGTYSAAVPEPTTGALIGVGLVAYRLRRRRST